MDSWAILVAYVCITVLILWAIRSIVCWYWKIDRVVGLLENIDKELKELKQLRDRPPQ